MDQLYPPSPLWAPEHIPVMGRYRFAPAGCAWHHSAIRGPAFQPQTCLAAKKRMLIIGDSHARLLYHGITHRLKGEPGFLASNIKGADLGNDAQQLDNLSVEFIWDPFGRLEDLPCEDLPDVVLISAVS
jgi:hypothetical protein